MVVVVVVVVVVVRLSLPDFQNNYFMLRVWFKKSSIVAIKFGVFFTVWHC